MMKFPMHMSLAAACVAALVACASDGNDISTPLGRKFHWFSFVQGEDIRASCQPGLPDRYRLVYNGIYDEQLRIYEWDSAQRRLLVRVTQPGSVARIGVSDPLGPWRAEEDRVPLDQPTYDRLVAQVAASGAFGPPAVGLDLPSRSYFWTAATCHDGQYRFTGWRYPSAGFDALTFPATLFGLDRSEVAVNGPGPVPFDPLWEDRRKRGEVTDFTMKIGAAGLVR
jgi:hypothetical protein